MYRVGETVRYWGVKVGGLTWFSSEIMMGTILEQHPVKKSYRIEGQSGTVHDVPEKLIDEGSAVKAG
ncbi:MULTISPECIES: hypothetical protein [Bacillus]|uniref:hypothetical protein n=1 Tax=Bacillus TaxID=1386 RepID=UPI000849A538|nr:hypothetical protein [Bacillus velezensis]SLC33165.1 Uncharacterised protein [Mycobacteroides abscessus subsp. massiliense]MCA1232006.1 hypothetical protein [Bacillus velezensis]MCA1310304.1 hypothetical protein [Bacillus velezensis]MCA1329284.1 hypothetical protein [Bacillus velezensis]MCM3275586.1 hypothetical protein [Bacillus velezensis]